MSLDRSTLRRHGFEFIRLVWCDNANVIRAKAAHIGQLEEVSEHGLGISTAQQAVPVLRDAFVAESGLGPVGEIRLVPDWSTLVGLPFAPGHARVMGDMVLDGQSWAHCPRDFLKRSVEALAEHGLSVQAAFENEFYLLRPAETAGGLEPVDRTLFASVHAMNKNVEFLGKLTSALLEQGVHPVNYYPESGFGQYELSTAHGPALLAADQQLIFRETVHAVAAQFGWIATFLPKPFPDQAGSGCHLHLSLWQGDRNLTRDPLGPDSPTGHFIAGILEHLPGLMALTAPTRNSYARFGRHLWSGAFAAWGYDNREAAVRVPTHPSGVSHFELKTHDATANPYLALGGVLSAGLDGIRRKLPLPDPVETDPGLLSMEELVEKGIDELPNELSEVLEHFEEDDLLQACMGAPLARSYLSVKREELQGVADLSPEQEIALLLERY
jgi:glutamine synthetase